MLAPEPLRGIRVVGSPEVLDAIEWPDEVAAMRLAPDDLFALGATSVVLPDGGALVADETGFVGWWLDATQVDELIDTRVEWELPEERPTLAQGLVAGVPAKLWLDADRGLLLCAAGYAHELQERLP